VAAMMVWTFPVARTQRGGVVLLVLEGVR
jgi:hypothetical protein